MTPTMKMMWHVTVGCFHARAAATGNARPLSVFRWKRGTTWLAVDADRRFRRDTISDRRWIHRRGSSAPVYGGICRPTPPACSGSDRDIEAMQITEERCHVLGSTGSIDQPRRRVEHGPQSVHQPNRDAGECGIAVVKARQNQWHDERHNHWARNWRTNAAESPQHRETAGHHLWDMSPHAQFRYIPRSRTKSDGTMTSAPTRRPGCGIWCWRGMDEHQSTSVLAVLSWRRLDCIVSIMQRHPRIPKPAPSAARHPTGESSCRSASRQNTDEEFISAEINIISTYLWPPKPRISKVPHPRVFVWTFRLRTLTLRWI